MPGDGEPRPMPARTYSELYQLAALAFAHPSPELHGHLRDGVFQDQFRSRAHRVFLQLTLPAVDTTFERFEADYIALFHHGMPGRESGSLFETDYLATSASRGAQLAELTRFYRACGLQLANTQGSREQPDHLVCQLELMAYLCFRQALAEATAVRARCIQAQKDFLSRRLQRWLGAFARRTAGAGARLGTDPFLPALAGALAALAAQHENSLCQARPA